jgi:hypothetical protein
MQASGIDRWLTPSIVDRPAKKATFGTMTSANGAITSVTHDTDGDV